MYKTNCAMCKPDYKTYNISLIMLYTNPIRYVLFNGMITDRKAQHWSHYLFMHVQPSTSFLKPLMLHVT